MGDDTHRRPSATRHSLTEISAADLSCFWDYGWLDTGHSRLVWDRLLLPFEFVRREVAQARVGPHGVVVAAPRRLWSLQRGHAPCALRAQDELRRMRERISVGVA
jgi:hypothetical protein